MDGLITPTWATDQLSTSLTHSLKIETFSESLTGKYTVTIISSVTESGANDQD